HTQDELIPILRPSQRLLVVIDHARKRGRAVKLEELLRSCIYAVRRNDVPEEGRPGNYPIRSLDATERIVNPARERGEISSLKGGGRERVETDRVPAFPKGFVVRHEKQFILTVENLRQ